MLSLTITDHDPRQMTGNWVVLGRSEAHGEITCTRDAAQG
jgi:hypothetical protein